jgi:hypothetical protein
MPTIINKYIDDYWFSTNIIDCCNIIPSNKSNLTNQNSNILKKKLNNNNIYQNKYNINEQQTGIHISITESNNKNSNSKNRIQNSTNRIQDSNNNKYYKKRANKHCTFYKDNITYNNERNVYSMPETSRVYDSPSRESVLDTCAKPKLNFKPNINKGGNIKPNICN